MISGIARLRAKKGFTMIELLVVIAIIGIVTAIVLPTLTYDNKPNLGKAAAKDLFYAAQDVMSSAEMAYPKAIPTGKTVTFYAKVRANGTIREVGSGARSGGTPNFTLGETVLTEPFAVKHDKTAADDLLCLQKKVFEMFTNDIVTQDNMEGMLIFVADDQYRVTAAYWTDSQTVTGDLTLADTCIMESGQYCCAFPTKLCDPGAVMLSTAA